MKTTLTLLLLTFTIAGVIGQVVPPPPDPDMGTPAAEEIVADDVALQVEEKEIEEVILDMKADEDDVVNAPSEPVAAAEEAQVVHEEEILEVQMEDVEEMMLDIKDDEMDNDADIIERKLDDVKDAKEHNDKSAAERKELEKEKKKRRNAARHAKREKRKRIHAERHKKVDAWIAELKKNHPNNKVARKREAVMNLYDLINSQHANLQS